jgi:hypothetical protein
VKPLIHWPSIAAPVSEKARKWVLTAGLQRFAEHISGGDFGVHHAKAPVSDLPAADFSTRQ